MPSYSRLLHKNPKKALFSLFLGLGSIWVLVGCIPVGQGPTPRMLRKNPQLITEEYRKIYSDSILSHAKLIEFPYRQVDEIRLSWKVVAGLRLSGQEIGQLKQMILDNVTHYWEYQYPYTEFDRLALENLSVMDAQILLDAGYPLLLYSAYDIRSRKKHFTFESFDICVGYQGLTNKKAKRVSFKLNSGLRGYIDSQAMLTGSLLDVPKLKNSEVQVLQVLLLLPPGQNLDFIYALLKKKYSELEITQFTLPVLEKPSSIGSIR